MNQKVTDFSVSSRLDHLPGKMIATVSLFVAFLSLGLADSLLARFLQNTGFQVVAYMLTLLVGAFVLVLIVHRVLHLDVGWRRLTLVTAAGGALMFFWLPLPIFPVSGLSGVAIIMAIGAAAGATMVLAVVWVKNGFARQEAPL